MLKQICVELLLYHTKFIILIKPRARLERATNPYKGFVFPIKLTGRIKAPRNCPELLFICYNFRSAAAPKRF